MEKEQPIQKSLELKRSIMLSHGLRLPDQELDKMQVFMNGDGTGFVLRFQAMLKTADWKIAKVSCL